MTTQTHHTALASFIDAQVQGKSGTVTNEPYKTFKEVLSDPNNEINKKAMAMPKTTPDIRPHELLMAAVNEANSKS